jgi:hypothetical protein
MHAIPSAKANQAAFDAGKLAERLAGGYYAYIAALQVATDPLAKTLATNIPAGQIVPVGFVKRKDGTHHVFHFHHYLDYARSNEQMANDLPRAWLVGSLLAIGDALSNSRYFDRAPELELLRHLRNGVAHGNRFHFGSGKSLKKSLERLQRHPAHNRLAWIRDDNKSEFEIVGALAGRPILFDFMGPGDILDLIMSVGLYLIRMGNGDPLRPNN